MTRILILLALLGHILGLCSVNARNTHPIILVHGFMGFGREEMGGLKYWGMFHGDYEARLRNDGFDVRTAVIGPVASNWDRACELYAYIKGGCVNYGPRHAAHFNHNATGRCYDGIYPEWGTVIDGQVRKVHLIGHSMGGQTIRMLAQLLAHGSKGAPIEEDPQAHELFAGGKGEWIHSITTIATPNMGTTLGDIAENFSNLIKEFTVGFFNLINSNPSSLVFDAKLDQWGISQRQHGEGLVQYYKRVLDSPIFAPGFEDTAAWDLSVKGTMEDNSWVSTLPNVYYYSFSNQDTFRLFKVTLPRTFSMLLPLQPMSTMIGSTKVLKMGFSQEWQHNDGLVPTFAMTHDGEAEVVEGVVESLPGRWHHVARFDSLDHGAVIGMKLTKDVYQIYRAHSELLTELPSSTSLSRFRRSESSGYRTSPRILETFAKIQKELEQDQEKDIEEACKRPVDDEMAELCVLALSTAQ